MSTLTTAKAALLPTYRNTVTSNTLSKNGISELLSIEVQNIAPQTAPRHIDFINSMLAGAGLTVTYYANSESITIKN